jgi:hypothetical protein
MPPFHKCGEVTRPFWESPKRRESPMIAGAVCANSLVLVTSNDSVLGLDQLNISCRPVTPLQKATISRFLPSNLGGY